MKLQASHNLLRIADAGDSHDIFPGPAAAAAEVGAEANPRRRGSRIASAGEAAGQRWRGGGMAALAALLLMGAGAQAQLVFQTPQPIGVTSSPQFVTVTAQGTGSVSRVEVLTGGQSGQDFAAVSSGTSCATAVFTASNHTCTQSVTFTPVSPGLRMGAVVLLDSSNNVLATGYLSGVGKGGLAVLEPGNWIKVAGIFKQAGGPLNGGQATGSELFEPSDVTFDGAGNMYIADSANNQVRMVCAAQNSAIIAGSTGCTAAGVIINIAGDGFPVSGLTLNYPTGVALDGAGNVYIADKRNNVIRRITAATGQIATVAGDGYIDPNTGGGGYAGDNGPATQAELNFPQDVTIDVAGNLFIADQSNNVIRRVDAVTGIITTVAGGGTLTADGVPATSASLSAPFGVSFDSSGNMYIPDSGNNKIRVVEAVGGQITPASVIKTAVGTGAAADSCANGPTSGAGLLSPSGVAVDAAGNLYISDTGNLCIRKTNAASGLITQIVLTGNYSIGQIGNATGVQIYAPEGIFVDGTGNVFFADHYFMLIDELESNKSFLEFLTPVRQGSHSTPPQAQIVENDGNDSLDLTAITPDANAAVDPGNPPTTCASLPYPMAEDADCTIGAIFAPSVAGNQVFGNINVTNSTSLNNPLDIELLGIATAVNTTTISVASSLNPSEFGTSVTFTTTVQTGSGTGSLAGAVQFYDGTTLLADVPVGVSATTGSTTSAQATYQTSTLAIGSHSITVTYDNTNDPTHSVSTSAPPLIQVVYEATRTTLKAAPASPSPLGTSVTFTAAVAVKDGGTYPLDGTVTFTDSQMALANNTVNLTGGVATYTAAALVQGVNVITATYTPATASTSSIHGSSASLNQDVVWTTGAVTVTSTPNPSVYGSQATFTVLVPNSGSTAATGKVNIVIVPQGQTAPTYPITATLAGNPGTGIAAISTLPVGAYTATATYEGDNNYSTASGILAIPQVVTQVPTTTTLIATPDPAVAGQSIAITATVAPTSGTAKPTGNVTFTDTFNGTAVTLGTQALSGTGTAVINTATLAPGTHAILASYAGDLNDAASVSVALSLVVNQATTSTTVAATPSPSIVGGTITFTATIVTNPAGGTPTGSVTFTAAGSGGNVAMGSASLAGGKATITYSTLPVGTYQITATYSGDTNDAASTGTASETVGLIPTVTALTPATVSGANVLVALVLNDGVAGPAPTGTVTFLNGTTTIGSATLDANGVASLTPNLATGSYTITAQYGGDATHSPSTSEPITITGAASTFSLTVTPPSVTMRTTQNASVTVTLTSIAGFTDTIGLGCVLLPAGVYCHFSSITAPLSANGKDTVQLTIDTNNPLGGGSSAMNRQSGSRTVSLAGLLLPFSLLLGCVAWRFRRRHAGLLSMGLMLVLGSAALLATGCSGFSQSSAVPGTYSIQVVGVGQNSNVTQYQNVTLNITK